MSSTTAGESGMLKVLAMVIGALTVFTLFSMLVARLLSNEGSDQSDELMRNALIERIEPVGQTRTSLQAVAKTDATVTAERTTEELVQGACAACHVTGVADAPKLDDADAWATRREAGLDALIASVTAGKSAMPPRGGSDYTDDEIRRAVEHMAGFAASDSEASATDSGDAAPAVDSTEEPAASEQSTTAEESAASEESASTDAGEDASEEAAQTDAGAAVTAELTDSVKAAVDGICSGCHIAGVAGAPKIGDKAEWDKRAAVGVDAMAQTVISGKGAMPPRGGSALTDEEMPAAISYLMSK
jgi:cytochrome c5